MHGEGEQGSGSFGTTGLDDDTRIIRRTEGGLMDPDELDRKLTERTRTVRPFRKAKETVEIGSLKQQGTPEAVESIETGPKGE